MKLSQMIDGFFVVRRNRYSEQMRGSFRHCFNRFSRFFEEDVEFASITSQDIKRYVVLLESDGLKDRSINDYLVRLTALWSFAQDEFKLPNIIREVEKRNYSEREIVPFTQEEVKAILNASEWMMAWNTQKGKEVRAKRPTWRRDVAILMVLVDVGLRATELCKLTVGDYHSETGRLLVRFGKGNKQRTVFLGTAAQRVLWRYMMSRDRIKPADPLFITRENKSLIRTYLAHMITRLGNNAKVPNAHAHRFRHTFAIQYLRNGGNIFELQRILGHEELDTVKIYLQYAEVDIERAQRANSPADNWRL